jgi:hypothetical protein
MLTPASLIKRAFSTAQAGRRFAGELPKRLPALAGTALSIGLQAAGEVRRRIDSLRGSDEPAESTDVVFPAPVAETPVPAPAYQLPADVVETLIEETPGAELAHDELPLEDYDHLTIGSLRSRLRSLDTVELIQLRDYERAHANRLPILTLFENRIAKLAKEELQSESTPA